MACTISDTVLYDGRDTLSIGTASSIPLLITLPEAATLSFAVRVPQAHAGGRQVCLWVEEHGTKLPGSRVCTSGANAPLWQSVGPLPLGQGARVLTWVTQASDGGSWPGGVAGFFLGEVLLGDDPVSLKLWCGEESGGGTGLAPRALGEGSSPAYSYYTSFEEHGIWYFLRYIPWLDWSSIDFITHVRQSDKYALSGKYSAEFVQVPPYGASTLWSREMDIPASSSHASMVFGAYAVRGDAKLGYKIYFDDKLVDDKVAPVYGAGGWFRYFIDKNIPIGTRQFKFELTLEPLPNVPLDNALYVDDLQVDFGTPPPAPPRTLVFPDLGGNIYGLNNLTGAKRWQKRLANGYTTAPVTLSDDAAYYGTNATPGLMAANDAESGDQLWAQRVPAPIDAAPAIIDTVIYVVAANGMLYGFNRASGTITYQGQALTPPPGEQITVFANVITDGVAYITSSLGVDAYDIGTKTHKWHYPSTYAVKQAPTVWDDCVYFGRTDGSFIALHRETGSAAWSAFNAGNPIYTVPQVVGGLVVFGTDGGDLYCLNAMNGQQVWKISKPGRIRGFRVSNDRVYFVTSAIQGIFYAYGFQIDDQGQWSFTTAWTTPVAGGIQQSPLINDDEIYFTGGDKKTYALDAKTGSPLWSFASDSIAFASPTLQRAPAIADLARRYDQCCYLCAHNAFANAADGWLYAEQTYSLTTQLNDGVRALMLDAGVTRCTIEHALGPDTERVCGPNIPAPEKIYFIHENLTSTALALMAGLDALREFSAGLREIKEWMGKNTHEVVTIILESQVSNATLMTQALADGGVTDLIFWADKTNYGPNGSWNVATQGWPTLQWMVQAGKRLVILSQHRSGNDGLPNVWNYAVENDFGSDGLAPGCSARGGSRPLSQNPPALFIMNYFVDWSVSHAIWYPFHYGQQNDYFGIIDKVNQCFQSANRLPNFIAVDYYQRGNNGGPKAAVAAIDGRWKAQVNAQVWEDR